MNEKIDVLAVMDAAHATFDNLRHERRHADDALRQSMHWTARIEEIIKARAAIAELIERERKVREALRYVMACVGNSGAVEHAAREAAEAVLAEGDDT
jgi:hypothetical protein